MWIAVIGERFRTPVTRTVEDKAIGAMPQPILEWRLPAVCWWEGVASLAEVEIAGENGSGELATRTEYGQAGSALIETQRR